MRMRKKKHRLDRFNALTDFIIEIPEELYINPHKPFELTSDTEKPLRLEIGCGKGDFIMKTSEREDSFNYYAMEKATDVIITAAEKYAEKMGLGENDGSGKIVVRDIDESEKSRCGNVRFINTDAANLASYFPENTFSSIYLNFSDPWRKKGYTKRRLTHIAFLDLYSDLLIPGGTLEIKTDNSDFFDFTIEQLAQSKFNITWETRDLHNSERAETNIMTEYEIYFSSQGTKINSLTAQNGK
jgi:tRNA (guanine-N(7)-)-methyltransferase